MEEKQLFIYFSFTYIVYVMSTQPLVLFLDQLLPDEEMSVSWTLDPDFLDFPPNDEVQPSRSAVVQGVCSLVDGVALLNLQVKAFFFVRCALCNESFEYEVCIDRLTYQELVENIKKKRWDVSGVVREAIVIEIPFFPQCGGKECLHREEIQKYLHVPTQENEEEKSSPFQSFFDTVPKE